MVGVRCFMTLALDAVAWYHDVEAKSYAKFRSLSPERDMARAACHFGLSGVDRVTNLVRRAEKSYIESRKWKQDRIDAGPEHRTQGLTLAKPPPVSASCRLPRRGVNPNPTSRLFLVSTRITANVIRAGVIVGS